MIRACDIKRGAVVQMDDAPHIAEEIQVQTPSARGGATLYKIRFRNLQNRQKLDKSFKGDDTLTETDFERREVQFLYSDSNGCTFMDVEDYSQFTLPEDVLKEERAFMTEGLEEIQALITAGRIIGIELPPTVKMEIVETGPSMKGASATARTKPATLTTGHIIKVPEYMENGEIVKVDTRTGAFLSRA